MSDQGVVPLLRTLPGRRILVIGDVILDQYVWGEVKRISPEAPVPVVEVRAQTALPGGAANVAANIAAWGCTAHLGGVVGRDAEGESLCKALAEKGVSTDGLWQDATRQTTSKTRIIAHSQQVVRLDREQPVPLAAAVEDRLLSWAGDRVSEVDACVLSDYAKGVVSRRLALEFIGMARAAGKPIVVDPKESDCSIYRGATVIKPNLHEAEQILNRRIADETALMEAGRRLAGLLKGTAVLITRGPQGMLLFREGLQPLAVATVSRNVYDVTGAGDTVIAMMAAALAAGLPLEQGVRLGNLAAGVVVGKVGTATATLEEIEKAAG
jgi:rfaE bifunctional protein kinase chain/domain